MSIEFIGHLILLSASLALLLCAIAILIIVIKN